MLTDEEIAGYMGWRGPGAYTAATLRKIKRVIAEAENRERERICAAIKAEDDHCADGDYMMDSNDCISVARGTWQRPDWNGSKRAN